MNHLFNTAGEALIDASNGETELKIIYWDVARQIDEGKFQPNVLQVLQEKKRDLAFGRLWDEKYVSVWFIAQNAKTNTASFWHPVTSVSFFVLYGVLDSVDTVFTNLTLQVFLFS